VHVTIQAVPIGGADYSTRKKWKSPLTSRFVKQFVRDFHSVEAAGSFVP